MWASSIYNAFSTEVSLSTIVSFNPQKGKSSKIYVNPPYNSVFLVVRKSEPKKRHEYLI